MLGKVKLTALKRASTSASFDISPAQTKADPPISSICIAFADTVGIDKKLKTWDKPYSR